MVKELEKVSEAMNQLGKSAIQAGLELSKLTCKHVDFMSHYTFTDRGRILDLMVCNTCGLRIGERINSKIAVEKRENELITWLKQ